MAVGASAVTQGVPGRIGCSPGFALPGFFAIMTLNQREIMP